MSQQRIGIHHYFLTFRDRLRVEVRRQQIWVYIRDLSALIG
jgi:hypothetical protein